MKANQKYTLTAQNKSLGLFAQEEVRNALNYVFMGFIKLLLLLLILGYVCLNNRIRKT